MANTTSGTTTFGKTFAIDDIGLAISMGTNTKGTTTTNLMVDYVKVVTERVVL